jgi:hypothetical protein
MTGVEPAYNGATIHRRNHLATPAVREKDYINNIIEY